MGRFCVAWSNHNWVKAAANDVSRYCSKCGLVDPRVERYTISPRMAESLKGLGFDTGAVRPPKPSDKAVRRRRGKVLMLFARDGPGCFYCGAALAVEEAVLDHFIPASKGGPDELENRRASCIGCDKRKRDRMPWDFLPKRFGHLRFEPERDTGLTPPVENAMVVAP